MAYTARRRLLRSRSVECLVVEHGPVHHRQPEDLRDLLALDQVEQRGRVEPAQHVDRGADQDRRGAERVELGGVEHRHHGGEPVAGIPAGVERAGHRLEVDGQVGADHALGERGGARGVEVAQRVPVVDETLRLHGAVVGGQGLDGGPGPVGGLRLDLGAGARRGDHVEDLGHLADGVPHGRDQLGFDDDAAGAGVAEHVGHLVGPPAQVDRHADHAELGAGVVDGQEVGAVARGQGQDGGALVAQPGQAVGQPVDVGVELGVAEPAVPVDDRELRRAGGGGPGQAVADVDPADEVAGLVHGSSLLLRAALVCCLCPFGCPG